MLPRAQIQMWTDASDCFGTFLVVDRDTGEVLCAHQRGLDPKTHIFMKELMMYSEGIRAAHDLGYVHPEVVGDNAPALQALTRGVSTSYQANLILQQTSHIHRTTRWVGTLDNLSDPFSRDTLIPSLPWNIQQHVPRSTLKGLGPGGLTYIASSERSKLGDSSFLLQHNPGSPASEPR